jgi:hypothetical protein
MTRKFEFPDLSQLRTLYWQGWPTRRIARALQVDRSVVQRILNERGLPTYTHAGANAFLASERTEAERKACTTAARAARRRTGAGRAAPPR